MSQPQAHQPQPKLMAGEQPGTYQLSQDVTAEELLYLAKMIARRKLRKGNKLTAPHTVHRCLQTLMLDYPHEVFGVLLLDSQHRLITFDELFRGTIDSASVYPREVVKHALHHNAAAVILVHNHPSGEPEPSDADRRITRRLQDALGLVDIRVLDHVVVAGEGFTSFVQRGWL
ncbi:DNA repair protein RadC [Halomonas piscis]|uniref:DNA repair protein RadC n=1 Tax=Halomonas piscis TaxID=3031727 RepID=A0ABY9Z4C3_9GAMM|nr:DNA repair protein RadC [Halomonas piscis]WNK21214.1 DNA repair protein RadC [Halomonas piscis]